MFNGNKISILLKASGIKSQDLLDALGIKNANGSISQIVNGNPTAKRLEAIADFFGVPIDTFFERNIKPTILQPISHSEQSVSSSAEIPLYDRLLDEKDKRIELLERMNSQLSNELERLNRGQN